MKRVLVTGATGFIGRHCLAPLVARSYEVHAASTRHVASGYCGATWHQVNLLDPLQSEALVELVRPTHLLHLAWDLSQDDFYNSLENYHWVQAGFRLVESFQRYGGERCLAAGTCYEYEQRCGLCSENRTPTRPNTVYGHSKVALLQVLTNFSRAVQLSFAWPRLFFLYGPGENSRRLVSSVITALLDGRVAQCSHGRQLRDYMFVEDVADGLVALLESDFKGPINLGCGIPVALRDIVQDLGDKLERSHLIQFGGLPARSGDVPLVIADTKRQFAVLNWKPETSLDTGLTKTIAWWQSHLQGTEGVICQGS